MGAIPRKKMSLLVGMLFLYIFIGLIFRFLASAGVIHAPIVEDPLATEQQLLYAQVEDRLWLAQEFMDNKLVDEGHVKLYTYAAEDFNNVDQTNSEALSYYLLWTANAGMKEEFDVALEYIKEYMLHEAGYLQWRVEANKTIITDGSNMASDADLRALKALFIAEQQWGDQEYTDMIDTLAIGLERMAVTYDGYLAPYAGMSGNVSWTAEEVWLSYVSFDVIAHLTERRGEPWASMYENMKVAVMEAQLEKGFFNSELTKKREYGNGIDGHGYGINSMWIMIRSAEVNDTELRAAAQKSLNHYKGRHVIDGQLFALYNGNGDALSPYDSPWVYALVGRAAVLLDDREFADAVMRDLLEFQVNDTASPVLGAFPEGGGDTLRVGQFTMQESIITMQAYLKQFE